MCNCIVPTQRRAQLCLHAQHLHQLFFFLQLTHTCQTICHQHEEKVMAIPCETTSKDKHSTSFHVLLQKQSTEASLIIHIYCQDRKVTYFY